MAKQLHISIPAPCHEKWNDMTPNAQGAFCKSCQKNVIDFSTKTENEIYEIISSAQGSKLCGRFTTFQLQQPIRKSELKNGFFNWRAIAASVAAFFSFGKLVSATDTEPTPKTTVVAKTETADTVAFSQVTTLTGAPAATIVELPMIEKITVGKMALQTTKAENTQHIKGKVVDAETNEELTSAIVKIKGTSHGVMTDFNGDYEIILDSLEMQQTNLQIEVSYIGYQTTVVDINEFKKKKTIGVCPENPLVITAPIVRMQSREMLGGLVVVTVGRFVSHRTDEENLQDRYDPKLDIRKKVRVKAKKN